MRQRLTLVCAVVTLCFCTPQAQSPETPSAGQLRAWLDAFNGGDPTSTTTTSAITSIRQPE